MPGYGRDSQMTTKQPCRVRQAFVSQISSMDEIWLRGAGSTHNEPHAAAQRCQPTPAVRLGCL
eukprot:scaffold61071_cov67-Phaeocystis_antarctica.AAC.1